MAIRAGPFLCALAERVIKLREKASRTKKIPTQAIRFIESLRIPTGPKAGSKLKLAPFQREIIAGTLDPETQYSLVSIARGGGKSALIAALALGGVMGIWDDQPAREIVIAARTRDQGRICWSFCRDFISTLPEEEQALFTVRQNPRLEIEYAGRNVGIIRVIAADGKNALGLAPAPYCICDEVGHWSEPKGSELFAALESSLGKRGAKMICISTSASSDQHFFSQLLDEPPSRSFVYERRPESGCPLDDVEALRYANPGAEYGVGAPLEWLVEQGQRAAKRGGNAAANFRLYNLNQRVASETREMLLQVDDWLACECAEGEMPARAGPVVIGLDIGGSSSFSGAAYYWYQTGRLECYATCPANPGLEDRGVADRVGRRYLEMHERGELSTMGDLTVPVAEWLGKVLRHVDGEQVACLTMDRYKQAELTEACTTAGVRAPLVWRGQGFRDGSEDAGRWQRACLDGRVKHVPSLLMRSALAAAVVIRDDANNMKITKSRSLDRIDAVSAAVLAVAEGARRMAAPERRAARVAWA